MAKSLNVVMVPFVLSGRDFSNYNEFVHKLGKALDSFGFEGVEVGQQQSTAMQKLPVVTRDMRTILIHFKNRGLFEKTDEIKDFGIALERTGDITGVEQVLSEFGLIDPQKKFEASKDKFDQNLDRVLTPDDVATVKKVVKKEKVAEKQAVVEQDISNKETAIAAEPSPYIQRQMLSNFKRDLYYQQIADLNGQLPEPVQKLIAPTTTIAQPPAPKVAVHPASVLGRKYAKENIKYQRLLKALQ